MEKRLVIVMGNSFSSRLGMIRAAGEAGCDVAVIQTDRGGGQGRKPVDSFSKYVTGSYCRLPLTDFDKLVDLLIGQFGGRSPKPVLLPTDDYTASAVDLNIDRLKAHFLLPGVGGESGGAVRCMDKALQKALARQAGFSVAKGWTAKWSDGRYAIPDDIEYPCFVKPEISYKGVNKLIMSRCDSRPALEAALSRFEGREDYPILIEQFIDIGQEYDVPGLSIDGNAILPGIIKKGEIYLGVTATGEAQPMSRYPEIAEKLGAFLRLTGFTGLIDIELFESGGTVYFNELNLRFGASGFGLTGIGVNLPKQLVRHLYGDGAEAVAFPDHTATFASERTLLQERAVGEKSREEYRRMIREADFTFIGNPADPRPYAAFRREERIVELKRMIKNILGMK